MRYHLLILIAALSSSCSPAPSPAPVATLPSSSQPEIATRPTIESTAPAAPPAATPPAPTATPMPAPELKQVVAAVVTPEPAPIAPAGPMEESTIAPNGKFKFPDDLGGKLLSDLLIPRDPTGGFAQQTVRPLPREVPLSIAAPTPGLPLSPAIPPALTLAKVEDLRPRLNVEAIPQDLARPEPELPTRLSMPIGPIHASPITDYDRPVEIPTLATRSTTRASLEDPTDVYSAQSAVGAPLPLRNSQAPAVIIDLPNPFENAEVIKFAVPESKPDPMSIISIVPSPKP